MWYRIIHRTLLTGNDKQEGLGKERRKKHKEGIITRGRRCVQPVEPCYVLTVVAAGGFSQSVSAGNVASLHHAPVIITFSWINGFSPFKHNTISKECWPNKNNGM